MKGFSDYIIIKSDEMMRELAHDELGVEVPYMGKLFKSWMIADDNMSIGSAASYVSYMKRLDVELLNYRLDIDFFDWLANNIDACSKNDLLKFMDKVGEIILKEKDEKEPLAKIKDLQNWNSAYQKYMQFIEWLLDEPEEELEERSAEDKTETAEDELTLDPLKIVPVPTYDGLDPLRHLFGGEDKLIEHLVENTYFINPSQVKEQISLMAESIKSNRRLYVRWTSNNHFRIGDGNRKAKFRSKKEAVAYTTKIEGTPRVYHRNTNLPVKFDSTNNAEVQRELWMYAKTPLHIGRDNIGMVNYHIAHLWGMTHNPLMFTALWNVCIIPVYLKFLTENSSDKNPIFKKVTETLKWISWYVNKDVAFATEEGKDILRRMEESGDFMKPENEEEYGKLAKKLIKEGKVKFFKPTEF